MTVSVLDGKTLVALGDSLIYGCWLGNKATWVNKLGVKHNMTVYNHGVNSNTLAKQDAETATPPMCERYAQMEDGADYVVVLGGANDRRLNVPIGKTDSRDPYCFKGAVNVLIDGLTTKYPRAKILFMTNYRRWSNPNGIGLYDRDYVDAMLEVCAERSVPCFDNYRGAGISFFNPGQLSWIDEGITIGKGENHHFSDEAYDWLLPKYEHLLESL